MSPSPSDDKISDNKAPYRLLKKHLHWNFLFHVYFSPQREDRQGHKSPTLLYTSVNERITTFIAVISNRKIAQLQYNNRSAETWHRRWNCISVLYLTKLGKKRQPFIAKQRQVVVSETSEQIEGFLKILRHLNRLRVS